MVGLLHADATRSFDYYRFTTANGTSMAISDRHWLIANGKPTPPPDVAVGDILSTQWGPQAVASIDTDAKEAGLYHVVTPSGRYYVDGVLATTYVDHVPYAVWRVFADGYIHLRYLLGAPIVPDGKGVLPLFAVLDVLPDAVASTAWPLTVLCIMASEIVNKLVSVAPAVLLPAGATALALSMGRAKAKAH